MPVSRRAFLQLSSAAALAPAWSRISPLSADMESAALCRKLASDPLRPRYHLLPAHNWMNDPNGPIFLHGRCHMFYQYNPRAAVWGNMNWAHATSRDMIHWQHCPIALSPTPGGPDRDGVFSGSMVLDEGRPTIIYTGVAPPSSESEATLSDGVHRWREVQCLAVAQDDNLRTWKKRAQPVIAAPPAGLAVTGFRDPSIWKEGDHWMLILGSGVLHKGGAILLYSSLDLRQWTYLHPLIQGSPGGSPGTVESLNPVDTGDMWECPDFFPLGDKHVLLISTMGKVRWKVGTYANQVFTPEKEGVVDWGAYYAAKTMLDADGHRILWGWITETRPDADLIAAGWAGAMSLPRVLSLNSQNELQMEVAPAVQQLRAAHTSISYDASSTARQEILGNLRLYDLAAELQLEFRPKTRDFDIRLQSESGENFLAISCANQSRSQELRVDNVSAQFSRDTGSPLRLHIFLDGSVLEVFVNRTTSLTKRVYKRVYRIPYGPLMLKLAGDAELTSLDAWQMTPISKDRLTGSLCS